MAEIRVVQQRKRGLGWLWLLIVLALIALAIWYVSNSRVETVGTPGAARPVAAPVVAALGATNAGVPVGAA